MDTEHIVIITLLVLLVLAFLTIIIFVVVGIAKVAKITRPIRNTIQRVRKLPKLARQSSKLKSMTKEARKAAKATRTAAKQKLQQVHQATKNVRELVQSDLRKLACRVQKLKSRAVPPLLNVKQHIMRGLAGMFGASGDPCSHLEALWNDHINLTFYYGQLALQRGPLDQDKIDYTANELMRIQQDLSDIMQHCVTPDQRPTLTNLLKDHIGIVAQMAAQWRQTPNATGFDSTLVQAWFQNASNTMALFTANNRRGIGALTDAYNEHLKDTAAYLTSMIQNGIDGSETLDLFYKALEHAPDLANIFCIVARFCT
jgi:hypothetical protein